MLFAARRQRCFSRHRQESRREQLLGQAELSCAGVQDWLTDSGRASAAFWKAPLDRDPNMQSHAAIEAICSLLETFVSGADRSLRIANEIEVALDQTFPADEQMADYVSEFAMYRPGGGDYLYDEAQLVPRCGALLEMLRSGMPG